MPLIINDAITKLTTRLKAFMDAENPAFTEEELEQYIDEGVEEYATHKPLRAIEEVELVSGQDTYDFPEDAERVIPILILNVANPYALYSGNPVPIYEMTTYFSEFFESPALQVRSQVYNARFYKQIAGRLTVNEQERKFMVRPTPTVSMTVQIPVVKAYDKTIPDMYSPEQYVKIPNSHVGSILDWCQSQMLRSLASAFSSNNLKVGDRDYRGSFSARDLIQQADELEESFRAKMVLPGGSRS